MRDAIAIVLSTCVLLGACYWLLEDTQDQTGLHHHILTHSEYLALCENHSRPYGMHHCPKNTLLRI